LIGFPGLDLERRLAVDQKRELAVQHITGFGAGDVTGGAPIGTSAMAVTVL